MGPKKKKAKEKDNKIKHCIIHFKECSDMHFTSISTQKLENLQEIARKRQQLPKTNANSFNEICNQIPQDCNENEGYHRYCYKKFKRNLNRIIPSEDQEKTEFQKRKSRRIQEECVDGVKFKEDCIFCNKLGKKAIKRGGVWTTEKMIEFEKEGWQYVVERAEEKSDEKLLTRVRGIDLFAVKAKYHTSCRSDYSADKSRWRSNDIQEVTQQQMLEDTHACVFDKVCKEIDETVIRNKSVIKMTDLRDFYARELGGTEFANDEYRSEKLKKKIEKHEVYANSVSFVKISESSKFQTYLLYSNEVELSKAIEFAYKLGVKDNCEDVAIKIRKQIHESYVNSQNIDWPPNVDYLKKQDVIPKELLSFLELVFCGRSKQSSSKISRLINSIGQDICRATTNSAWKLPKHISLCLTLRHLFRSKELITLMNKLGHCENYSFTLELETAIATAADIQSSLLTQKIVTNPNGPSVFHSEFDNFDQLVNDLTGKGSVHTAHGIMLQEFSTAQDPQTTSLPSIPRSKQRSWKPLDVKDLEDCYVTQRVSPQMLITQYSVPGSLEAYHKAGEKDFAWILLRYLNKDNQTLPSWAGFVSMTGVKPSHLTVLDYYPVIYKPITQYSTVQECLRVAEKATDDVGQYFVYTTFDLGVCMKAYPLIWKYPQMFNRHVVLIGTFHLAMGYYHMIGKKMEGSGFTDVLLEANLASSLSVNGVLSGKNYNRATFCHKTLLEALHRLLLIEFLKRRDSESSLAEIKEFDTVDQFTKSPSEVNLTAVTEDPGIAAIMNNYSVFCESVRHGQLGKTAQFWISYMDHVSLVLTLRRAVKTNDFELYSHCLSSMPDLFFSFGGQNYARYLTYYSLFLSNLESTHPGAISGIKLGAFSVARSYVPGNRCAVDKTMEETFMKVAKSRGGSGSSVAGISGICQNYSAYQRWIKSMPQRCMYLESTYELAGMTETGDDLQHRDNRESEIRKSEYVVDAAVEALNSFVNPFSVTEKEHLFCISSGQRVPSDIEKDVMNAELLGQEQKQKFIEERLKVDEHFFDPVKRLNLKTISSMSKKVPMLNKNKKVIELKQQGNITFQLLVKSQEQNSSVDLEKVMSFQLTPVPYCLGTPDGFLNKTNKAKGFSYLTSEILDTQPPENSDTLVILDGNAMLHALTEIPDTFYGICEKVFSKIPKVSSVIFSTDTYHKGSIKAMERERRGIGEKLLIKGPNIKRPADWKNFLSNDENKVRLMSLLLEVWSQHSFAHHLLNRKVVLVVEGQAFELSSTDGVIVQKKEIEELRSNQEETDTRIVLYAAYGARQQFKYIKIRSPDSDIFFILLHFAFEIDSTLLFDTGVGNSKRLLNVSEIARQYGKKKCTALMGLHVFTGCDTSSAFKGIGKVKPIKLLFKKSDFDECFENLGTHWNVDSAVISQLEQFTCSLYGYPRCTSANKLRYNILKKKCNTNNQLDSSKSVDLSSLPPCQDTLLQHIKRSNLQLGIWKRAEENYQEVPDATEHGWIRENLTLEPLWCEGDILPRQLADLLEEEDSEAEEQVTDEICDISFDSDSELIS